MNPVNKTIVIPGDRYGKLTIIRELPGRIRRRGDTLRIVLVRCDCGGEKKMILGSLRIKRFPTVSCGCQQRKSGESGGRYKKHGMSHSPEYESWRSMIGRCKNQNASNYYRYGGRGITICPEWKDFRVFFRNMGPRPKGTTLGRIDSSKGYTPDNCRWETHVQQNNNLSSNQFLKYKGKILSVMAWSRELNLSPHPIYRRLKRGWSAERIFETPVRST